MPRSRDDPGIAVVTRGIDKTRRAQAGSPGKPPCYCCVATRALGSAEWVQEDRVATSDDSKVDDSKISEDRREALRYALAVSYTHLTLPTKRIV